MATLHWRVIALLFWLTLFFNIERLDIAGTDTINFPSGIYIVAIVAAVLPLFPVTRNFPMLVLGGIITVAYAIALYFSNHQIIGEFYTYLTLVGFFMLIGTLLIAARLGHSVEEFRKAVEDITFSGRGSRLRSLNDEQVQEIIDIEMSTSRRAQRPLSLVMLQADSSSLNMTMHRLVQEVQRSMMQRYVLATAARVLSRNLRRGDMIVEDTRPGRLLLIAPETSPDNADIVGARLTRVMREELGVKAYYSTASFPNQALTFEKLRDVAEQKVQLHAAKDGQVLEDDDELDIAPKTEQPVHSR